MADFTTLTSGIQKLTATPTGPGGIALNTNADLTDAHLTDTDNPHATTASQVGTYTTEEIDAAIAAVPAGTPGGTTGQLQYNNAGVFAADTATTDGAGNLTVSSLNAGGGTVTANNIAAPIGTVNCLSNLSLNSSSNQIDLNGGAILGLAQQGYYLQYFSGGFGITATPGSGQANGTFSAQYFVGDGSGLTNVPNRFNQSLNTTDSPTFSGVNANGGDIANAVNITASTLHLPAATSIYSDSSGNIYLAAASTGNIYLNSTGSGTVQAGTKFQGDGSLLTGLTASQISGIAGCLINTNNLSDVASVSTARTNLGLGTAATSSTSDFDAAGTAAAAIADIYAHPAPLVAVLVSLFDTAGAATAAVAALGTASTHAATDFLTPTGDGSGLTGLAYTQLSGRPTLGTVASYNIGQILQTANNLSDLASVSTAISNLGGPFLTPTGDGSGLSGIATTATINAAIAAAASSYDAAGAAAAVAATVAALGTASTHAATDFLQSANNLSDLANAGTARTNIGLGSGISTTFTWLDGDGVTTRTQTIVNGIITAAS